MPVGTAENVRAAAAGALAPAGADVELAWNPEFLREGFAVDDTLRPDRIVFGVATRPDPASPRPRRGGLRQVYAPMIDAGSPSW